MLDALIKEQREQAFDYKTYLVKVKEFCLQVGNAGGVDTVAYPTSINSPAKKALCDNLDQDEVLANKIDMAVRYTKKTD